MFSRVSSTWWWAAGLVLLSVAVYGPVIAFSFVNFDDGVYVFQSPLVRDGLQPSAIWRAFSQYEAANWHPLTWLSLMLDRQLFGFRSGWYHFVNLLQHILATLILFQALREMTGDDPRSAFVAALFAVHPLHVESVAWISERKDTLSGVFWMLTLLCYARYVRAPALRGSLAVAGSLALGLMAKQMLVTLPCVLLLLDVWPLKRVDLSSGEWSKLGRLALEKLPLLAICVAAGVVTIFAQHAGEAVQAIDKLPMPRRLSNAVVAYVMYLAKTLWPFNLAVFYPYNSNAWPLPAVLGAAAGLCAATAAFAWQLTRRPALLVGWLWYVGTLVPVIGLLQVGGQAMADRYTYIPLIGIFLMLAWGVNWSALASRRAVVAGAVVLLALCAIRAGHQVLVWRNSRTLFTHAVRVAPSTVAHNNLALTLKDHGEFAEAEKHFREAVRHDPGNIPAWGNLGAVLKELDRWDEAENCYRESLRRDPNDPLALTNLGDLHNARGAKHKARSDLHVATGELDQARADLQKAHGAFTEGESILRQVLARSPDSTAAYCNLGVSLRGQERRQEAREAYLEAIRLDPENALALSNLASLTAEDAGLQKEESLQRLRLEEAAELFRQALAADSGLHETRCGLAMCYAQLHLLEPALAEVETVLRAVPGHVTARELQQAILLANQRIRPGPNGR